jgi:hypothetical protein
MIVLLLNATNNEQENGNGQARGAFMHTKLRHHVTVRLAVSGSIELYVTHPWPGRLVASFTSHEISIWVYIYKTL